MVYLLMAYWDSWKGLLMWEFFSCIVADYPETAAGVDGCGEAWGQGREGYAGYASDEEVGDREAEEGF